MAEHADMAAFEYPASVRTDQERALCLLRLQQKQMDAERMHLEERGMTEKCHLRFIKSWQPRRSELARHIIPVRLRVFDALGYGPLEIGQTDHPWLGLKPQGRAETKWDPDIKDHPILRVAEVAGPDLDPYEVLAGGNYDEVDGPGRLSFTGDYQCDITDMDADEEISLTKDFGAGFFTGPFTHYSVAYLTATAANARAFGFGAESDSAADYKNGGNYSGCLFYIVGTGNERIYAFHAEGGVTQDTDNWPNAAPAVAYYITREHDGGTTVTTTIHIDSHGGTQQDVLEHDDDGDARGISHAVSSYDIAAAARPISGYVKEIDLQQPVAGSPWYLYDRRRRQ